MSYLVAFEVADGDPVLVEVDDEQLTGFVPAAVSPGAVAVTATESLERAIDKLVPALTAIANRMKQFGPHEVTVALGVKLTAEAGAIVAKAAGESNFTVPLRWNTSVSA